MHVVIDFDYTLFNTAAMRNACIQALRGFGVTEQHYRAAERELKAKRLYDIEQHLDMLATGQSRMLVGEIIHNLLSHADEFLYPDATAFLQRHSEHTITLLSFGSPVWQKRKIDGAHLGSLVHNVIVTDKPKATLLSQFRADEQLVFLNDRGSELDTLKAVRPDIHAIWVRRPATPYSTEPCYTAEATVSDLSFFLQDILPTTL